MRVLIFSCVVICAIAIATFWPETFTTKIIFNRTYSAPIGFYWVENSPVAKTNWVAVSAKSEVSNWAYKQGFISQDWPIIKRVAALHGTQVCREGVQIVVNGEQVAIAQVQDNGGRALPAWTGCKTLNEHEVFLLNDHPKSLDGRYFGVMNLSDLDGVAKPVWIFP